MIIHQPEINRENGEICVSSRIEMENSTPELPDRLWFRFPESYSKFVSDRSDGFAASMLLLANYFGKPLQVRGVISPRLAYGLQEYQRIFQLWMPKIFPLVDIRFDKLQPLESTGVQNKIGLGFSGGVDSLYTLRSHLPQDQKIPSAALTHGIFIHGIDIGLDETEIYHSLYERYARLFQGFGLQLLTLRTNVVSFYQFRVNWNYSHGGPMVAPALIFGKLLSRYYISATNSYLETILLGTSPVTDHWLSTETLEVIHYGGSKNRAEKIIALGDWPAANQVLRVCAAPVKSIEFDNCGRCNKCMRTIVTLEIVGVLDKFATFERPFRYLDFLRWGFLVIPLPKYGKQILKLACAYGRIDIALPMLLVIILGKIKKKGISLLFNHLSKDVLYRMKRRIYGQQLTDTS